MEGPEQVDAAPVQVHGPVSAYHLEGLIHISLAGRDLSTINMGAFRAELCQRLGLPPTGLDGRRQEITDLTQKIVQALKASPGLLPSFMQVVLVDSCEKTTALQYVYFVTISRLLPETVAHGIGGRDLQELSRQDIAKALLDSLDQPLAAGRAGRPRGDIGSRVVALVVFQEKHADDSIHYHAAVKLAVPTRFLAAKRTLRERHKLPSHWSCSHTQFWSAVRYGVIPSTKKPTVDPTPYQWTQDGQILDLFAVSQEPYQAELWRCRRERRDSEAAKTDGKATFTKMDLTSLIVSKHLYTKDTLIAYVQEHGTAVMQSYINKVQRKLVE